MPNTAVTHLVQKRLANPLMRRNPMQTLLETTGRKSGEPRLRGKWHTGTAYLLPDDDPHARLRDQSQLNASGVRTFGTNLLTVRVDLGDPQVVNSRPVGLARLCTLRSWLVTDSPHRHGPSQ